MATLWEFCKQGSCGGWARSTGPLGRPGDATDWSSVLPTALEPCGPGSGHTEGSPVLGRSSPNRDTSLGRKDGAEPGIEWTGVGEASSTDVRKGVQRQRGHEEAGARGTHGRSSTVPRGTHSVRACACISGQ